MVYNDTGRAPFRGSSLNSCTAKPAHSTPSLICEDRGILHEDEYLALPLLDRPIAFQRIFVTIAGSVTAALFLSQAVYWHNRSTGGFHKSRQEWEEETGLTRREQETARKTLRDLGFLSETQRGTDRTIWYSVNETAVLRAVQWIGTKRTFPLGGNVPMERADSDQCLYKDTETTTETTTDILVREPKFPPKTEREKWFQEFCRVYPKRAGGDGRSKAAEKFDELLRQGVDPEDIVAGAKRYAAVAAAEDQIGTRFVCQKSTWLNQRKWEDDYGAVEASDELPVTFIPPKRGPDGRLLNAEYD